MEVVIFNTTWKVLRPIFLYPTTGLSIRQIAKLSGISHSRVINIIKNLQNEELVTIEKKNKIFLIKGNFENENFVELKKLHNYLALRRLSKYLENTYFPDVIICFGSYAEGLDFEKSDIDLYIGYKNFEISEKDLNKFEKTLNRQIHIFTGNLKNMPAELRSNIINGIKLYGWIKI